MGTVRLLSLSALVAVAMGVSPVSAQGDDLTWTGSSSNSWDTSTENWLNGDDAVAWSNDDNAAFGEEGDPEVAITEDITAGAVTVTGEGVSYTFMFDGGSLTAGNLTIYEGASLTITETGTLKITGTLSNEGTLTLGDTSGSSDGMGPVSTPGTVTVDLASAIENSGEIIIGDGVVFILNESLSDVNGTYTFITGEGGSIVGWDSLTTSNFMLDGKILTGRSQLDLTDGQVTVEFVEAANLVWDGTEEEGSAWNKTSDNWKNEGSADLFYDYDNVTFNDSATSQNVSIGEAIIAGSVKVESGEYTWEFARGGSLDISSLDVAYGASLEITMTGELTISGTVTNAGSLTFDATVLDLASAIVNTGKVTVGDGVTLVLNDSLITTTDGNGTTYTFITNTGGTIEGWDSLTKSNFMLDGSVISGRSTVDVREAGKVTVEIVDAANLIWAGTGGNSTWDTEYSANWKNGGSEDKFYSQDNVTFDSTAESKNVTIEESVMAGKMTVASGDYTFSISEGGSVMASSLTMNSGSSLTITGAGSLTISYSEDEQIRVNGTLRIKEGTTNLGGIVRIGNGNGTTGTIEITGGTTTFENSVMVGNNNSLETTSTIKISGGDVIFEELVNVGYVSYNATENATASGTLEITGGKTTFNNYVSVGRTNTAGTTATGTLKITGDSTEVIFYSLYVGYGAWDGSTGYGTAEITGGTVTVTDVTYIGRTGSDAATSYGLLTISDGDVTLGGATYIGRSITAGSKAYGALIITGGTTKITGDVYIGYVNVEGATANGYVYISGGTVTFGEETEEGEESEKHTVFVGSDYADNDTSNASFTISGTANVIFYDEVDVGYSRSPSGDSDSDSFTISGGKVTFNRNVYVGRARFDENTTANGSFTITDGETTIHTAYVGYADATNATAKGTFTISGGKTTFETASTIAYSYTAGASTEASMTISGNATEVYFTGDLFIGRAAADGATATGKLEISDGATVNFAGMQLGRTNSNGKSSYGELTIGTDGATSDTTKVTFSSYLYLGYSLSGSDTSSEGKATIYSGTVEFKSAQIGYSSAGGTGSGTIIIGSTDGGAPNVTFSGNVYIGNATDKAGSATGTIEIHSGTTTFKNAVYVGNSTATTGSAQGILTIDGGEVTFSNAFYVGYATSTGEATGSVDISGGKVAFNGNITVAGDSSFSVGTDAQVTIGSVTIDLASAIENTGTITVGSSVKFVLNDSLATTDGDTTTYTLISGSGTIIVGTDSTWDTLGYANFVTSSGAALDTVHTSLDLDTAGSVTVTYHSADLIWTGKTTTVWENSDVQNWRTEDNTETYFANGDSVTFDDTADANKRTVSIAEGIVAGSVTVASGDYTWTAEDPTAVETGSLVVNEGASLTIGDNVTVFLNPAEGDVLSDFIVNGKINGSGTIELALDSNDYSGTINLGTDNTFTGTVHVTSGEFTLNGSDIGTGTYKLADGVNVQVTASGTEVKGGFILEGTSQVHVNADDSLTISGSISGVAGDDGEGNTVMGGVFDRQGAGSLTITGNVDIGTFIIDTSGSGAVSETTFSGSSVTIGTLDVKDSDSVVFTNSGVTIGSIVFGESETGVIEFQNGGTVGEIDYTDRLGSGTIIVSSGTLNVGTIVDTFSGEATNAPMVNLQVGEGAVLHAGTITIAPGGAGSYYSKISGTEEGDAGTVIADNFIVGSTVTGSGGASIEVSDVTLVVGALSFGNGEDSNFNLYLKNATLGFTEDVTISATTANGSNSRFVLGGFASGNSTETGSGTKTTINTSKYDADTGAFTNEGVTVTISQIISGQGELVVDGVGRLILSAANTYSGGTTIASGATVVAQDGSALGSGDVNVDGTLQVDTHLTVSDGTVEFSETGKLIVTQTLLATAGELEEGQKEAVAVITANTITFGTEGLSEGDVTELVSDYITVESGDYRVTGWYYYNNTLYACVIPEPSMFGMLFGLSALGLVSTRRRRRKA